MSASQQAFACVVSPNTADADLAVSLLRDQGFEARGFPSLRELSYMLDESAGCVIIVEEALVSDDLPALREALARLPTWADLPLILVGRDVAPLGQVASNAFPESGNVTLLERPLNPHTLASAVQVALRASARQREVGELLEQRDQAVKARDEFLAMLAHELRNPLAPMTNAVYMLRQVKSQEPLVEKSTDILERQVNHVARMVDDLMDVARLERGKVVLRKERVDLNSIVTSGVESCITNVRARGHRISVSLASEHVPVDADPVRMEQVVCNLVNNAVKFTPQPEEIRVDTSIEDGYAVLSVRDRGIGFRREDAERLFEPFTQANPTIERTAGGLGLGLTIVQRLVELHAGSVRADSAGPDQGSRFVVRLPLAASVEARDADAPRAAALRRGRRVVVVEDNPDIRESMRMLMHLWGHQVSMAADGTEGVALVLKERPDIALIDVGLPGINGYEVARRIRKVIRNREIRLIAITGYGQPNDRELAMQAGFDTHLLKPVKAEVLEELLSA